MLRVSTLHRLSKRLVQRQDERATSQSQHATRCTAVEEETRDVAIDVSISIRNAILAGETPVFESSPTLTANALAQKELEHRAAAAEIALSDLEAQASEAMRAATAAADSVRAAGEALMLAEATAIAERVASLDAQSLALRVRLGGGAFAPIAVRGQALSPVLPKVLRETDELGLAPAFASLFAGELHWPMREAGRSWLKFIDELVLDPDAELNFDRPAEQDTARAA